LQKKGINSIVSTQVSKKKKKDKKEKLMLESNLLAQNRISYETQTGPSGPCQALEGTPKTASPKLPAQAAPMLDCPHSEKNWFF